MHTLTQIGFVALGSALGGLLRWGIGVMLPRVASTEFPWATFIINITGCLFLGWFATLWNERLMNSAGWISADNLKLLLAVGFTGAYTTFSTFELETNQLLREGVWLKSAAYVAGSVFLGLVAVRLGAYLADAK